MAFSSATLGSLDCAIVVDSRVVERTSLRGDDFAHESVVRLVVRHAAFDPAQERPCRFLADQLAIDFKQIGPFMRPVRHEFGAADQFVDDAVALDLGIGRIVQERSRPLRGRRQAGEVERHAAEKLGVGAGFRWKNLDALEFFVDERVDVIILGNRFPYESRAIAHDGQIDDAEGPFVTHEDRGLAAADGANEAGFVRQARCRGRCSKSWRRA